MNIGTSTENRLDDLSSNRPNKSSVNFLINGLSPTSVGLGLSSQDLQLASSDIASVLKNKNNDIIKTPPKSLQCTTPRVVGLETPQFQQLQSQSQSQFQSLPSLFSPREERSQHQQGQLQQQQQQQQQRTLPISAIPLSPFARGSQGHNYDQPSIMSTRISQEPAFRLVTPNNDPLPLQTGAYRVASGNSGAVGNVISNSNGNGNGNGSGSSSSSDINSLLDSQLAIGINSSSPANNNGNGTVTSVKVTNNNIGGAANGGDGGSYTTLTSQEYSMKPIFSPTSQRNAHSTSFTYNDVVPQLPLTPPVSITPGSAAVFPPNTSSRPYPSISIGSSDSINITNSGVSTNIPSQPLQSTVLPQDPLPPLFSSTFPVTVASQQPQSQPQRQLQSQQQRFSSIYSDDLHRGDLFFQQNNIQQPGMYGSMYPSYGTTQYDPQNQYQYQYQYQNQPPPFYTFHTAKQPTTASTSTTATTSISHPTKKVSKSRVSTTYSHRKKINQCHICGKILTRASSLHSHMFVHTGDRPYMCSWPNCKKRFNVKSNMNRHYKLHLKRVEKEKLELKREEAKRGSQV